MTKPRATTAKQPMLWVGLAMASLALPLADAFQSPLAVQQKATSKVTIPSSPTGLFSSSGGGFGRNQNSNTASSSSTVKSSPAGDFAYQEMVVLLTAMQKEGATSRDMDPAKRRELEGYVQTVLKENQHKSLPLKDIGQAIADPVSGTGSEWKLMFSSSDAVLETLPNDATVFMKIHDTESMDYTLKFSKKTMGLDSLTAKCHYTFDVSSRPSFCMQRRNAARNSHDYFTETPTGRTRTARIAYLCV